jgi:hypothetical protein
VAFLAIVTLALTVGVREGSAAVRPDPFFRMESPSGCTGGWFYAHPRYGLFGATCSHCVTSGQDVKVRGFADGVIGPAVFGRCISDHPQYDSAIIRVLRRDWPARLPACISLARVSDGPRPGQIVYSIGSFAGGTKAPAVQRLRIRGLRSQGYEFELNDTAWNGHSGGPVIDARTHRLLGNLWGAGRGHSIVTSHRALWDQIARMRGSFAGRRKGQAFYSVADDPFERKAATIETVTVYYADRSELDQFNRDWATHRCLRRIRWLPERTDEYRTPQFVWRCKSGRVHRLYRWPGPAAFNRRMQECGYETATCPGGSQWQVGDNPWAQGPWGGSGSAGSGQSGRVDRALNDKIQSLEETIDKLEDKLDDAQDAREDELRKLKREHEDELRSLRREMEDQLRQAEDERVRRMMEAGPSPPTPDPARDAVGRARPYRRAGPDTNSGPSDLVQDFERTLQRYRENRRALSQIGQMAAEEADSSAVTTDKRENPTPREQPASPATATDEKEKPAEDSDKLWLWIVIASVVIAGGLIGASYIGRK